MFQFKRWKIKRLAKKIKAMQVNRINNQPGDEVLKKEISYYFEMAKMYQKLKCNAKFPHAEVMVIECYRAAAEMDSAEAHYLLGKMFLDEGKYRQSLGEEGIFNSPENQKECQRVYEEAHRHLLAADTLHHIEAKRLRGLSIINGWGVAADKDAGFELVVASIDQEQAWDKVPQIFAAIGLNKPEFFAAIMQRRKG